MALTRDPKVIIADEPTTALDVTVQKQVIDLLNKLQKELGFAMVFVSHDLALVAEVANSITVMYAGQVVEQGPVTDILCHPVHEYTRGPVSYTHLDVYKRQILYILGIMSSKP